MAELRARFIEKAPGERAALAEALEGSDHEAIRRIAHSLAGSAGLFGFPAITDEARSLEEAAETGAPDLEQRTRAFVASLGALA